MASRHDLRGRLIAAALLALITAGIGGLNWGRSVYAGIAADLPPVPDPQHLAVSTVVLDRDGQLLRPFTTSDGRWRLPVTPGDVDRRFLDMLVAYEDQNFATHHGVDWSGMARAALQFAGAGGHVVSGGSTLTMQVARLIAQQPTRNVWDKLTQMVHAQQLERSLSKSEILTLYLTYAPYGGNIEGIRAASLAWFGKGPKRLTVAEAALLVALPQSPEARRPDRDPFAARAARSMVLERMVVRGVISAEAAAAAEREPIPTRRKPFPLHAPHLAQQAVAARPEASRIDLTVDGRLQAAFEQLGATRAPQLGPKASVAIVAVDVTSGSVLASVGSAGLFATERDGYVDMTRAVRSPGSTLKPLIYGLAFEYGLAHPESLIEDRPTAFDGYVPVNFDGLSRGTVSIRQALTQSLNIPAVIVLDAVGVPRFVSRLHRAGLAVRLPNDSAPTLAVGLGGVGVTLRELVGLYAAIARGGTPVTLTDGITPTAAPTGLAAPVLDPVAAWYVADILADVPPPLNGSAGRIAYKTGTSYGYRDAWAIGFDGETVIGVWVGRPDGTPISGLSGIATAAPILFESFDRLGTGTVPLAPALPSVLVATNTDLPLPLRRFRHFDTDVVARDAAPQIAFPGNGVDLDLGMASGAERALVVKVRNGVPPFSYFANGAPIGRTGFARQNSWQPDGPGYVTLSVVDSLGKSDSVKVFIE
ncbi:penicillin-binding protein 1C [Devosia sp.]|uniref:penicillin-binding protein 1C n=1 Tax=Devosia sp. TaxID=1871048 RepID=UPI003A92E7EA